MKKRKIVCRSVFREGEGRAERLRARWAALLERLAREGRG